MLRSFLLALMLAAAPAAPATALDLEGRYTQGGLILGKVQPGTELRLNGEPVKVADNGRFVIGFGRDAALEHSLVATGPDGRIDRRQIVLDRRDYRIERVDGLPPKTVDLPPEYYERRGREMAAVGKARAPVSDFLHWAEDFQWPAHGRISGVYGSQRILNGQPRSPHYGIDIAAPTGTPVVAPAGGVVRLAHADFLLEGGIIIIDHGFGVSSTLFHLETVEIEEGEEVAQGERIATVGATGRATGPHVDWRINWKDQRLDPGLVVGAMPGTEGGGSQASDGAIPSP